MAEPWSDLPIGAPARRALMAAGLLRLADLPSASRAEIAALHGMGPKALGILDAGLADAGLSYRA